MFVYTVIREWRVNCKICMVNSFICHYCETVSRIETWLLWSMGLRVGHFCYPTHTHTR